MDRPALNDPGIFPDQAVLAEQLGPAMPAWEAFLDLLKAGQPRIAFEWRYYRDGKSWLFKVTEKKKTLCWVSAWDNFFKTTFYFTTGAEEAIRGSSLPEALKTSFLHPTGKGSLRPITVEVRRAADLEATRELMGIKSKLK